MRILAREIAVLAVILLLFVLQGCWSSGSKPLTRNEAYVMINDVLPSKGFPQDGIVAWGVIDYGDAFIKPSMTGELRFSENDFVEAENYLARFKRIDINQVLSAGSVRELKSLLNEASCSVEASSARCYVYFIVKKENNAVGVIINHF